MFQRRNRGDLSHLSANRTKGIFKPEYRYAKSGVMLMDLRMRDVQQGQLFDTCLPVADARRERLLATMDRANGRWGHGTLAIGSTGVKRPHAWEMKRGHVTPAYTTRWAELAKVS